MTMIAPQVQHSCSIRKEKKKKNTRTHKKKNKKKTQETPRVSQAVAKEVTTSFPPSMFQAVWQVIQRLDAV